MEFRRELWELRSSLWTLPISVEWHGQEDVAIVRLGHGLNLFEKQRSAGETALTQFGTRIGNKWQIMRGNLSLIANLSEHTDPQDVVRWEASRPQVRFRKPHKKSSDHLRDDDIFFAECVKAGIAKSAEEAELIHRVWCKTILHCLVNLRLSIGLLFVDLHALPYRSNWQNVLFAKIHSSGSGGPSQKYKRMPWCLLNTTLFAWIKSPGMVRWTVNVVHRPMWYTMIIRSEKRAAQIYRREYGRGYLWYLHDTILHLIPQSKKVYEHWQTSLSIPNLAISRGNHIKLDGAFPEKTKTEVSGKPRPPVHLPAAFNVATAKEVRSERINLLPEDVDLPNLPRVRQ